jgi:hypothetical protein
MALKLALPVDSVSPVAKDSADKRSKAFIERVDRAVVERRETQPRDEQRAEPQEASGAVSLQVRREQLRRICERAHRTSMGRGAEAAPGAPRSGSA